MKKSPEQMKALLEKLIWKWQINANAALENYDISQCRVLKDDIDTLKSLLELVENKALIEREGKMSDETVLADLKTWLRKTAHKGRRNAESVGGYDLEKAYELKLYVGMIGSVLIEIERLEDEHTEA